jgi:hypothetical protein
MLLSSYRKLKKQISDVDDANRGGQCIVLI